MFSLPTLIYIISSTITFVLIYSRLPTTTFQQITIFLLLAILVLLGRVMYVRNNISAGKAMYLTGLFLSSFFIQILILATGGIYSPFLILIHIFTLGSSFLINIASSMIFLILTLSILVANIYFNPQMLDIFKNDPGSAILYFASFIAVVPLARYIVYRYHLKDSIFKVLKEYAETGEQRETSILNNISEFVVVTDKDLRILSINEALEQSLNIPRESCVGRLIFEVIPLKNQNDAELTADELSIAQILADKATRIVNGFFYKARSDPKPRLVAIQIRPVLNSDGEINQMVFLITGPQRHVGLLRHSDLQEALTKQRLLIEDLKNTLIKAGLTNEVSKIELINKTEIDLMLAFELEDHPIVPNLSPEDIALIGKQSVASKQNLARCLGVSLQFVLPKEEISEASYLSLIETNVESKILPVSSFAAPVDKQWFTIILQKLLDIGLLLASEKPNQQIELIVGHNVQDENLIDLSISIPYQFISDQDIQKLFVEYYPNFTAKSNLSLGSGLEGFIAKNIIDQLNIPFDIKFIQTKSRLSFSFTITKSLSQNSLL